MNRLGNYSTPGLRSESDLRRVRRTEARLTYPQTASFGPRSSPTDFFARNGHKQFRGAGEILTRLDADQPLEHLERSGFVVLKSSPDGGGAALGHGHTVKACSSGSEVAANIAISISISSATTTISSLIWSGTRLAANRR